MRYCGPGYMVAVGYMDPGNWATGIESGSKYGYSLLFIILVSNVMAMVLQHLCVRLGCGERMDLAQACRQRMPKWANFPMWLVAEIAIISCDLAEVIGTAIALKLLFGLPIIWGVLLTILDVLLLMAGIGWAADADTSGGDSETRSYKILEIVVIILMSIIGICFVIEMWIVKPVWSELFRGFLPMDAMRLMGQKDALFSALGIIGATVMPHNLYLHSSIVQRRLEEREQNSKSKNSKDSTPHDECNITISNGNDDDTKSLSADSLRSIINYATADSTIALFFALFINAAILIVSSAAFHSKGRTNVIEIEEAEELMRQWLGPMSAILFGAALLAAGQSSTVTGTLAGQIVFEGHLKMKMRPWMRRLITRGVAILPAVAIILVAGENSINELLIASQVVLSFQLPFAIIPLIIFVFHPSDVGKEEASLLKTTGHDDQVAASMFAPEYSKSEDLYVEDDEKEDSICSAILKNRQDYKIYWENRRKGWVEFILKISSWAIALLLVALNFMYLASVFREFIQTKLKTV